MKRNLMRKQARAILDEAERADGLAIAADGPVPPTWEMQSDEERRRFYRSAYLLAQAVLEL